MLVLPSPAQLQQHFHIAIETTGKKKKKKKSNEEKTEANQCLPI